MKATKTLKWTRSTIGCVLLGLVAVPPGNALADDERKAVPPGESVLGMSQGDWGAAWWQWILSIPAETNPLFDDGTVSLCTAGQGDGPVFFLAGSWAGVVERSCTVPAGQALFFPLINTECSSVEGGEGDPWFCATEAECRQCAGRNANGFDPASLVVIVDGKRLDDLDQYRQQSAAYTFTLPEDDILGEDETAGISVSDGYWVMLKPLSPGEHTIYFYGAPLDAGWWQEVTYTITVE
ncbi:MAG: hypothetical protein ABFS45_13465 [Pseudomonadota bacterium]